MCGKTDDTLFPRFCKHLQRRPARKRPNLLGEPGGEKNVQKTPVLLPQWPSAETNLLRSGQVVGLILKLLKGDQNSFKGIGVP
jgi:hypothetical protein